MTGNFVRTSENRKTGPISVTYHDRTSCPPSCPLWNGCYAKQGPTLWHWRNTCTPLTEILAKLRMLPAGRRVRLGVTGDLPGVGERINARLFRRLDIACKGLKAWAYTHKRQLAALATINRAQHLAVSVSCETLAEVDAHMNAGRDAVVAVPRTAPRLQRTPAGRPVIICPAQEQDSITCATCGNDLPLCARKGRDYAIAFRAHGKGARIVEGVLRILNRTGGTP